MMFYQYQAVMRSDASGNITRYRGFKVKVVAQGSGNLMHLAFFRAGSPAPNLGRNWIDLADPDISDPASNGFTNITTASAASTIGALFLTQGAMSAMSKPNPKFPQSTGW